MRKNQDPSKLYHIASKSGKSIKDSNNKLQIKNTKYFPSKEKNIDGKEHLKKNLSDNDSLMSIQKTIIKSKSDALITKYNSPPAQLSSRNKVDIHALRRQNNEMKKQIKRIQEYSINLNNFTHEIEKNLSNQLIDYKKKLQIVEGKNVELEKVLEIYEGKFENQSVLNSKELKNLIVNFRNQNCELQMKLKHKRSEIQVLNVKLRNCEANYSSISKKLSVMMKKGYRQKLNNQICQKVSKSSQNKQNLILSNSINQIGQFSTQSPMLWEYKEVNECHFDQLKTRLDSILQALDFFKEQNQKIENELTTILENNHELMIKNALLQQNNHHYQCESAKLKNYISSLKIAGRMKISQNIRKSQQGLFGTNRMIKFNNGNISYIFREVTRSTLNKLRYNLMNSGLEYQNMLNQISQIILSTKKNKLYQILQQNPYSLKSAQAKQFELQHEQLLQLIDLNTVTFQDIKSIIRSNIQPYSQVTKKIDKSISNSISKSLYLHEKQFMHKVTSQIIYQRQQYYQYLKKLGLKCNQIDFIGYKYYELTGVVDQIDFQVLYKLFVKQ